MSRPKPFRPDKAAHVQFGELHTDFILSICMPDPELMVGEDLAVLVVTTVVGQRVGAPMGVKALEHLRGIVAEGLRSQRSIDEDTKK